jgi:hypothetical protein
MRFPIHYAALVLLAAIAASPAHAESLPPPTGKVILTISGKIQRANKDATAQFDRAMLESIGIITIETSTPWHDGVVKFEGIRMDELMTYVGAHGDYVLAIALNDYSSEIPMEDFGKHDPILALKLNGEYMPVSDKGPLFIVYPYDSAPELKSQEFYGRSVWQVAKLVVQ